MGKLFSYEQPLRVKSYFCIFLSNTLIPLKVATWKPATLSEKVLQRYFCRKFSDDLKRVTVKNPYGKTSVLESLFNEIAGINSRLAFLVKKSLHQRHLPVSILELSALLQESFT